ncbi:MAG: plastocyanin/azurin family copper-binding protein [Halobacteriaceae archaeon]
MDRRTYLKGAGMLSMTVVGGCVQPGATTQGEYDVGMGGTYFTPQKLTVTPDTTVVWKNTNSRSHTVTAVESGIPEGADYFASGGFESEEKAVDAYMQELKGRIITGETYSHTFSIPGTYNYYCIPHRAAGMVGQIVVSKES